MRLSVSFLWLQQELPGDQGDVSASHGHVPPSCVLSRPAGNTLTQTHTHFECDNTPLSIISKCFE